MRPSQRGTASATAGTGAAAQAGTAARHTGGRQARYASAHRLPTELVSQILLRLEPRDYVSAILTNRRWNILTPKERTQGTNHLSACQLAKMGDLLALELRHDADPWAIDRHCLVKAARHGRLHVVRWIIERSHGGGCPTLALCEASRGGHIRLMRWLVEEASAHITREAMVNAVLYGHVDALVYFHEANRRQRQPPPAIKTFERGTTSAHRLGDADAQGQPQAGPDEAERHAGNSSGTGPQERMVKRGEDGPQHRGEMQHADSSGAGNNGISDTERGRNTDDDDGDNNDGKDDKGHHTDDDDDDDEGGKDEEDEETLPQFLDSLNLQLGCAAGSGSVAMLEFMEANSNRKPTRDGIGEALVQAAVNDDAASVEWLVHRRPRRKHARKALRFALSSNGRSCATAILRYMPDAVVLVDVHSWQLQGPNAVEPRLVAMARSVALDRGAWPALEPVVAGHGPESSAQAEGVLVGIDRSDCDAVYDALLVHSLARLWRKFPLESANLDIVRSPSAARWMFGLAPQAVSLRDIRYAIDRGDLPLLAMYHDGGMVLGHTASVARHAAACGRFDVLRWLWAVAAAGHADSEHLRGVTSIAELDALYLAAPTRAFAASVQAIADSAAHAGNWHVIEWLQQHFGPRAHCTAAAFSNALAGNHADFLERLYATGADRCRHAADRHDGSCTAEPGWTNTSRPIFQYPICDGLYDYNELQARPIEKNFVLALRVLHKHGHLPPNVAASAIYTAALKGHTALCSLLLKAGARPRALALCAAVQQRDVATARLFIEHGAKARSRWRHKADALLVARKKKSWPLLALVRSAVGADRAVRRDASDHFLSDSEDNKYPHWHE